MLMVMQRLSQIAYGNSLCVIAASKAWVDVLKVLGDQLGYFSPPSLAQAAPCVAAAELGYFQPIAKIPQVPSANRHWILPRQSRHCLRLRVKLVWSKSIEDYFVQCSYIGYKQLDAFRLCKIYFMWCTHTTIECSFLIDFDAWNRN